jgi:hypothetical protein
MGKSRRKGVTSVSNVQIDGNNVMKKYQDRLSEAMHTIILLEARVDALEHVLEHSQGTPEKSEKNGGPVSSTSAKKATVASPSPTESPS